MSSEVVDSKPAVDQVRTDFECDEKEIITATPIQTILPPFNLEQVSAGDVKNEVFEEAEKCKKEKLKKIDSRKVKKGQKSKLPKTTRCSLDDEVAKKLNEFYDFSCKLCPEPVSLVSFGNFKVHMQTAHNDPKPSITCCGSNIRKRWLLIDHMDWHQNPNRLKCLECGKISTDRRSYRAHEKSHTESYDSRRYHCDLCPRKFNHLSILRTHMFKHLSPETRQQLKTVPCPHCDKKFKTKTILCNHIRIWHEEREQFVCHVCAKSFKNKYDCDYHFKNIHMNVDKERVECPICKRDFANQHRLQRHRKRVHDEAGEHVCKYCNKVSPTLGAMNNHIKYVHVLTNKFKCDICDKGFKKAVVLKEHMTVHFDANPLYTCTFCDKTFNSKGKNCF